jgi:hypothetical protein
VAVLAREPFQRRRWVVAFNVGMALIAEEGRGKAIRLDVIFSHSLNSGAFGGMGSGMVGVLSHPAFFYFGFSMSLTRKLRLSCGHLLSSDPSKITAGSLTNYPHDRLLRL